MNSSARIEVESTSSTCCLPPTADTTSQSCPFPFDLHWLRILFNIRWLAATFRLSRLALKISTICHVFTRGYKWFSQTIQHIQPENINNIFLNVFFLSSCVWSQETRGQVGKKKIKSPYEFPVAAVTNYYKLSGLRQHKCVILLLCKLEVWHGSHCVGSDMGLTVSRCCQGFVPFCRL